MRIFAVLALIGALASPALAQEQMLLEVWLAGQKGDIVQVYAEDGHLFISQSDYAALGLSLSARPEGGRVDLLNLPGLSATIDPATQRLNLEVVTAALPKQDFNLRPQPASSITPSGNGAILRYSLSATADNLRRMGRSISGGGDFALNVFRPGMVMHNSAFAMAGSHAWNAVRLDSNVTFDNPGNMTRLTLGDSINITPDWSRSVRFAGIQYASDFELRPGLVTQPLPSFFGQSAVPATVDVFSGAVQVYKQQVNAGPFSLRNLPVVTGGGAATIVTTDVLGRQTSQTIALFSEPGMLAEGLESFSLDAGFLRQGFGQTSFGYRDALASGTWRKGLRETLTVQAHGEAAAGLGLAGGGAQFGVGVGTVSADFATSQSRGGTGAMISASAQAMLGALNIYGRAMAANTAFRDLASLDKGLPPPLSRYQMGATYDLNSALRGAGILGLSFIENRNAGQAARRFVTASWSADLPNAMFVSLSTLADLKTRDVGLQFSLSIPLGGTGMAGVSAEAGAGRSSGALIYTQPADPAGGWGWRGLVGSENDGRGQVGATYIGQQVAVDAMLAHQNGQAGLRANADGALVLLDDALYVTHNPGNAVALVETGAKNVRVYLENRQVARSDARGRALITGLNAYSANRIAIDPRDYPFDTAVERTEIVVTPQRQSGVTANLVPAQRRILTLQVQLAADTPLGARVMIDGDTKPVVIGHGGAFQIEAAKSLLGATVIAGAKRCRIMIDPAATAPLPCTQDIARAF